jgi:hypothetical protein
MSESQGKTLKVGKVYTQHIIHEASYGGEDQKKIMKDKK